LGVGCGFGVGWGFGGLGIGGGCGLGLGFGWGFGVGWGSKYINQHFVFRETAQPKILGVETQLGQPIARK